MLNIIRRTLLTGIDVNIEKARELLCCAGEFVELVSRFQACYGPGYRVTLGSDPAAWELFEAINTVQLRLALLLDGDVLEQAHPISGKWWSKQDVPDVSTVQSLVGQAGYLITACAYAEQTQSETAIVATQRVIAGALHPSICMIAQDQQEVQIAS